MDRVVPWTALVQVVEPYYPKTKTGRPLFAIETMLRIRRLQQWFALSDPAMEEASLAGHPDLDLVNKPLRSAPRSRDESQWGALKRFAAAL